MNKEEYEQKRAECWEEFRREHPEISCKSLLRDFVGLIFDRAYNLGKKEKDADTVIQGWTARDKNDIICLYKDFPERFIEVGEWGGVTPAFYHYCLPKDSFPDLTWEDDPIEVELIIKRKDK